MSAYTVSLPGPGPWGFRLQGGKDFNMPLTISRITPGSKAAQGNLVQGDVIVAIDGVSTDGMTHLEAQNKIKMANYNLALTMSKSKRPVQMQAPRIDAAIPMIPHQQPGESVQVNGRLSACNSSSGPVEAAASPTQRKQYNSPIGLYSEETLKEMAAIQAGLPVGAGFNPGVLMDSHQPIEVTGPGGKATIIHAQYNTPISMYSQDAIMDAIAGQTMPKGHDGGGTLPIRHIDSSSAVYQAVQSAEKEAELGECGRRSSGLQSKTFQVLAAHVTGTDSLPEKEEEEEEEALRRSSPTEHAPASVAVKPPDPAPFSADPPSQYIQPPMMHQVPQAPPPQHYQPAPQHYQPAPQHQYQQPPPQMAPPTQQSSIQIPVGSAPPKVVSTACIYPSQPAPPPAQAPAPPPPRPQPGPAAQAPPPAGPASSNRPPWVTDTNFADKFDPGKMTTSVKVQPLPQAAPPPPAYIPNTAGAPRPLPARGEGRGPEGREVRGRQPHASVRRLQQHHQGSVPGGAGPLLAPRGVQLPLLQHVAGRRQLRGGAEQRLLRELLRGVLRPDVRSLQLQDHGGSDARPAADVAHHLLCVRGLWKGLWEQPLPHGGRRAILRERLHLALQHQVSRLRLPRGGRRQVHRGSGTHLARHLLRVCGLPREPGGSTLLLQERQASVQEARSRHQRVTWRAGGEWTASGRR